MPTGGNIANSPTSVTGLSRIMTPTSLVENRALPFVEPDITLEAYAG